MSVVKHQKQVSRKMLLACVAFFVVSIGIAWSKPMWAKKQVGSSAPSSIQQQRSQAIAEARARGEKSYAFRSSFNPNNPGGR